MASTPQFKCYLNGEYLACTKHLEDAAALVSVWSGGQVRYSHKLVLWTEGAEAFPAGESYDGAAQIMRDRLQKYQAECYAKVYGNRVNV